MSGLLKVQTLEQMRLVKSTYLPRGNSTDTLWFRLNQSRHKVTALKATIAVSPFPFPTDVLFEPT